MHINKNKKRKESDIYNEECGKINYLNKRKENSEESEKSPKGLNKRDSKLDEGELGVKLHQREPEVYPCQMGHEVVEVDRDYEAQGYE